MSTTSWWREAVIAWAIAVDAEPERLRSGELSYYIIPTPIVADGMGDDVAQLRTDEPVRITVVAAAPGTIRIRASVPGATDPVLLGYEHGVSATDAYWRARLTEAVAEAERARASRTPPRD